MGDLREFLLERIRDGHPLPGAVVAFNRRFPARLQAGAVVPEAAPLLPLLAEDARASSRMMRLAPFLSADADAFGDNAALARMAVDFRVPRHRLALLEPETLHRLALWCGLTLHRAEVSRLIDRDAVRALREDVGEAGHLFALRRAALYPVARDGAPLEKEDARRSLPERVRGSGFAATAACLADAPPPVAAVLLRTLPEEFSAVLRAAVAAAPQPAEAARRWPLLRMLLFKEVAPAWEPCFT